MNVVANKNDLSDTNNSYRFSSKFNYKLDSKPSFTENIYLNQKKKILEIMNDNQNSNFKEENDCQMDSNELKY